MKESLPTLKAVNSRDKNYTPTRIKVHTQRIEKQIADYLQAMDDADQLDKHESRKEISEIINKLRQRLAKLKVIDQTIKDSPDKQISFTDPDARAMKVRRSTATIGFNVQTAVDTNSHLIVAHYVTNDPLDRGLLFDIGQRAQQALGKKEITVLADKGYFSGPSIKRAQDAGMIPLVPKIDTSGSEQKGVYNRRLFIYSPESDSYRCPAGKELKYGGTTIDKGKRMRCYGTKSVCIDCTQRSHCTTSKTEPRRIKRWEDEDRIEKMEAQLKAMPNSMILRKQTVEHPFGTIKSWMGASHFLCKGLRNVNTEISLNVLAYNFKRVIALVGQKRLVEAIQK